MTRPFLAGLLRMAAGMILLLAGAGCATMSDLENLNAGWNQKLEALDHTVRTQVEALQTDLRTTRVVHANQHEELQKTLLGVKAEMATTNTVTAYAAEHAQALNKIAASTEEVNKRLRSLRQVVATIESLPSLMTGVGEELHSLRQVLAGTFRIEEAALRDRLKALEHLRRQLTPLQAGEETGSIGLGKAASATGE